MLHASVRPVFLALSVLALVSCSPSPNDRVEAAEARYADFMDAAGALDTIDSGLVDTFGGADRATWQGRHQQYLAALRSATESIDVQGLSFQNRRALEAMRAAIAYREASSLAPDDTCTIERRANATGAELRRTLYSCFSKIGDAINFEGRSLNRTAALQLLERLPEAPRRRALFMALAPLWTAINADNTAGSPYRRLIANEVQRTRDNIASAERALGLGAGESEAWLVRALEAWRGESGGAPIEPWDFRFTYSAGARAVDKCAGLDVVLAANQRFFTDLGADLDSLGVIQDIGARPGMAPIDYADFARLGRVVNGAWRPAIPRVSVILQEGGLGALAEIAHEDGHAVHYAAMRSRPSLTFSDDLTLAIEAFADIPAWSVYTPEWQQRYLGCATTEAAGMRARLGAVALDLAWGLFEIRMARAPDSDPNIVWTAITNDYLHIQPHPEFSWWAVRGQLVDNPGYMINYALGAFVTADLRARVAQDIGSFDAGNSQWYRRVSETLFRHGGDLEPSALLRSYLGRPVSPDALIADLRRAR